MAHHAGDTSDLEPRCGRDPLMAASRPRHYASLLVYEDKYSAREGGVMSNADFVCPALVEADVLISQEHCGLVEKHDRG